jgi:PAS domain S-box-containing protein
VSDARDDRPIYISPSFEAVWGRNHKVAFEQPRSWLEAIHPDDRDETLERMEQHKHGVFTVGEFRVVRPDGSIRWIRSRAFPVKDQNGEFSRITGVLEDITERKRAEEALRASEQRFRTFVDQATDAIFLQDDRYVFLDVNRQACESLGYTRDELIGMTPLDFDFDVTPAMLEEISRRFESGEMIAVDSRHRRKDGSVFPVEIRGRPFREGGRAFAVVLARDITERKRLEGELRQAKEAAEAANRAKDEFLANVSHEIRTPMNAVLGMTELALDTPLAEEQRKYLTIVKTSADALLSVINDLLDFSKIEAGKLELEPADFSLRAALGDTLRTLAMRAHKKGLELVSHVQPGVPDALVGDAGRLRQVLINLVGNAIKFTEEGEVVVRVEAAGEPTPREVGVRFAVSDTGIGIPPDKQEKVFRAFEQEDTSTTRKYGGTGLGLTIAARLVALMGGTIAVQSEPSRGSTFAFTARFGRQPHPAEPVTALPPVLLYNLPVLIVDDNATNRRILEEWLRGWQMEPVAVGDGVAAMETLWDAAALGRPHPLVLLDSRMPDTDGLVLATKIRKRPELSATRIILLTSGDLPGDLARLRELRIDAHLLKPVQQDELLDTIYRVMSRAVGDTPAAAREPAQAPGPAVAPLRILVAEDNEFNAEYLERQLARRGHSLRHANNGQEALALLGIAGQGKVASPWPNPGPFPATDAIDPAPRTPAFDLMLMDLHMPELDGFQVVHAIREWERTAGGHLPIIALTARSRKEDRERCLAAGMDDFLGKPIGSADLYGAIERVVSARRLPSPGRADAGEDSSLVDPAVLLAACGDDAHGLREMCQSFQAHVPARMAEVGDALRTRDAPRLRRAAHKLCGLLSAFSTVAGAVASDLEDQAACGRLEESQLLVDQLEAIVPQLIQQVDGLSIETLRRHAAAADNPDQSVGH